MKTSRFWRAVASSDEEASSRPSGPKIAGQIVRLPRFGRFDQRAHGVFRRGEGPLAGALSRDEERVRHECRSTGTPRRLLCESSTPPPPPLLLPPLRELLRLLCPRVLAARSDCPLE